MSKNIVVCCDGTWNTADQTDHGVPCPTNVCKLKNIALSNAEQLLYYHPGVGTGGDLKDKLLGGALGTGLDDHIKSAYEWLCRNYQPGDQIYIFGFSRGAFTARSLGGFVTICGLLNLTGMADKVAWAAVDDVYDRGYRRHVPGETPPLDDHSFINGAEPGAATVHMIGVWDTVGALGIPQDLVALELLDDPSKYRFHNTTLSDRVKHARHAVALDEQRASFSPTLWEPSATRPADTSFKQIWFAGTHCDVGGGHVESGLSDIALSWMIAEAAAVGLQVSPAMRDQVKPDAGGVLHDSVTGVWAHLKTLPRAMPLIDESNIGVAIAQAVMDRHLTPPIAQAPYHPTKRLQVGQRFTVDVFARPHWNATGLYLEKGATYTMKASGEWLDAAIACGPGGSSRTHFSIGKIALTVGSVLGALETEYRELSHKDNSDWWMTKRIETADWFQLMGMIADQPNADASGTPALGTEISIGTGTVFPAKTSGYLYCYANDAWDFYGNNQGRVSLEIVRTA
jgi:hypothetical protein